MNILNIYIKLTKTILRGNVNMPQRVYQINPVHKLSPNPQKSSKKNKKNQEVPRVKICSEGWGLQNSPPCLHLDSKQSVCNQATKMLFFQMDACVSGGQIDAVTLWLWGREDATQLPSASQHPLCFIRPHCLCSVLMLISAERRHESKHSEVLLPHRGRKSFQSSKSSSKKKKKEWKVQRQSTLIHLKLIAAWNKLTWKPVKMIWESVFKKKKRKDDVEKMILFFLCCVNITEGMDTNGCNVYLTKTGCQGWLALERHHFLHL